MLRRSLSSIDHTLLGERAEAVGWLRRAALRCYRDAPWMRKDPILAPLAGFVEFESAVAEIEARRAQFEKFLEGEAPAAVAAMIESEE